MCRFCPLGPDEGEAEQAEMDRLADAGRWDRDGECRVCGAPDGEHNLGCPVARPDHFPLPAA